MSLPGALARLQVHATTTGMLAAPTYATEGKQPSPFSMAFPASGVASAGSVGIEEIKGLYVIFVQFHWLRKQLPQVIEASLPFIDSYPKLLMRDPTLDGAVDTIVLGDDTGIPWKFGEMNWGGVATVGIQFSVTVKIKQATS